MLNTYITSSLKEAIQRQLNLGKSFLELSLDLHVSETTLKYMFNGKRVKMETYDVVSKSMEKLDKVYKHKVIPPTNITSLKSVYKGLYQSGIESYLINRLIKLDEEITMIIKPLKKSQKSIVKKFLTDLSEKV